MMQREVVKPQYGAPITVKLDFGPEGMQRDSKFGGVQYLYTINDSHNSMYLDPAARDALVQSGAQAGDYVVIDKFKRGTQVMYSANVVSDASPDAYLDSISEPPPPPLPRQIAAPASRIAVRPGTAAARLPQQAYYQPEVNPQTQRQAPQHVHQMTNRREAMPQQAPERQQTQALQFRSVFSASIREAINCVMEFNQCAATAGLELRLGVEDARSILLSHYIGQQRGGRA